MKAIAFTEKQHPRYVIPVNRNPIPYTNEHSSLCVSIDITLACAPHVNRLKRKLGGFIQIIKLPSASRWGFSVCARLNLYNAFFARLLLRKSLQVLHGISRSNMKDIESATCLSGFQQKYLECCNTSRSPCDIICGFVKGRYLSCT